MEEKKNISDFLLEILACPICHGDLKLTEDEKFLKCEKCRKLYPIRDGIPILLVEEALDFKEK